MNPTPIRSKGWPRHVFLLLLALWLAGICPSRASTPPPPQAPLKIPWLGLQHLTPYLEQCRAIQLLSVPAADWQAYLDSWMEDLPKGASAVHYILMNYPGTEPANTNWLQQLLLEAWYYHTTPSPPGPAHAYLLRLRMNLVRAQITPTNYQQGLYAQALHRQNRQLLEHLYANGLLTGKQKQALVSHWHPYESALKNALWLYNYSGQALWQVEALSILRSATGRLGWDPIPLQSTKLSSPPKVAWWQVFEGEKAWYMVLERADTLRWHVVPRTESTETLVSEVVEHSGPPTLAWASQSEQQAYQMRLYKLYRVFFEPLWGKEVPEELRVITDGLWNHIPLGAMVVGWSDRAEYLIQYCNIIHRYRRGEPRSLQATAATASLDHFAPYAPGTPYRDQATLPLSGQETDAASGSQTFLHEQASLSRFTQSLRLGNRVHLSSHGQSSPEPALFFGGEGNTALRMTETDIPDAIRSPLVVLAACESGVGPGVAGEGMATIGQRMLQHGAGQVLTHLTDLEDQAAYAVMHRFYTHLESRERTSQALVNAQREYLDFASQYEAHPYFWSGWQLYETTTDPPAGHSNQPLLVLLLLGGALLLLGRHRPQSAR